MEALIVIIAALLADNLLLTRLFGVESFFATTQKPSYAALYGGLVTVVTVSSGTLVLLLNDYVLEPLKITYFRTFAAVMIITFIICLIQLIASAVSHTAHTQAESALPLISGNCVVLGSVLLCIDNRLSFGLSVLALLCAGVGFTLVMLVFSSVQKKLETADVPVCFKGIPILLISCALAAMAFSGFFGFSF